MAGRTVQTILYMLSSTLYTSNLFNWKRRLCPCINLKRFGLPSWAASVAQLVEHLHGMQDVTGSSPA